MSESTNLNDDIKNKEAVSDALDAILSELNEHAVNKQNNQVQIANSVKSVDACMHDLLVFIDNEMLNLKTQDNESLLNDLLGIISNIKSYAITTVKKAHRAQAGQVGQLEGLTAVMTLLTERREGIRSTISDFQKLSEESDEDGNIESRSVGDRPVSEKTKREYQKIVTDSE